MNRFISILILWSVLWDTNFARSACDDTDIAFIIDTKSIIKDSTDVLDFITTIIRDASSEFSGFTASLYGDNIPNNQPALIFNLQETVSIHSRNEEEKQITAKLTDVFTKIQNVKSGDLTKVIKLKDAFKLIDDQQIPTRNDYKKREIRGVSIKDDEREYFIWDHNNNLLPSVTHHFGDSARGDGGSTSANSLPKSDTTLCWLLNHNKNSNEETMHFLMGQPIRSIYINCDGDGDDDHQYEDIDQSTFFYFNHDPGLLIDPKTKELIEDITCPSIIDPKEFDGHLDLGNHNQWIDPDSFIKCVLDINKEYSDDAVQLNPKTSYILVKDYTNDDNTFKKNDYLMASPNVTNIISDIGCEFSVYRINSIIKVEKKTEYNILKLYVQLPKTPMEYIMFSNVKGESNGVHPKPGRDLLSLSSLSSGGTQSETFFDTNWPEFDGIFNKEYTKTKEVGTEYSIGTQPKFTFSGTGSLTINVGFDLDLSIVLRFKFDWDVLQDNIYVYFVIEVDWGVTVWFNAEIVAQAKAEIEDLLKFYQTFNFWIGPVPVLIAPFIEMGVVLETIPLRLYAGVRCHYGESLTIGYEYDRQTIFHPEVGTIRANTRYTLGVQKTWTGKTRDECFTLNYNHGGGFGLTCVWFDYNPNTSGGRCRCYGEGIMWGDTTSESGTTAYLMNRGCGNLYWKKCDGCGLNIYVKRDGDSFRGTCTKPCIKNGWPAFCDYSCTKHCFPGFYHWYCIRCDVFQENSGWIEERLNPEPRAISSRTPHANNGCTKTFQFGSEEENEEECPIVEMGFDITVETKIGVNLYSLVTVYARAELEIPFRITMPEFDMSVCASAETSCDNALQVSFTIAIDLTVYFGVQVDFGQIGDVILALIDENAPDIAEHIPAPEVVIARVTILPETTLACISMSGTIGSVLDTYYKSLCCDVDRAFTPAPTKAPTVESANLIGILDLNLDHREKVTLIITILWILIALCLCLVMMNVRNLYQKGSGADNMTCVYQDSTTDGI